MPLAQECTERPTREGSLSDIRSKLGSILERLDRSNNRLDHLVSRCHSTLLGEDGNDSEEKNAKDNQDIVSLLNAISSKLDYNSKSIDILEEYID